MSHASEPNTILKKRDILLGDDSATIDLTLWNEQAEQWSVNGMNEERMSEIEVARDWTLTLDYPIIVGLKNCRVKIFQGRSLSSGDAFRYEVSFLSSSHFLRSDSQVNPNSPLALSLSEWYEKQAADIFVVLPYLSRQGSDCERD